MPDIGFLNGRFMPLEETLVPVEDRGFQFGDGVYEVIRTYHGRPFQLDAHLAEVEERLVRRYSWRESGGAAMRRARCISSSPEGWRPETTCSRRRPVRPPS